MMRTVLLVSCVLAACDASEPAVTCGDNTVSDGTQCIPDLPPPPDAPPFACPSGTTAMDGSCVLDLERFEVRIAETTLGANGHTKRRVWVVGTHADGSPVLDDVLLTVDPPTAGTLTRTALTLDALGATTQFVPCHHETAGCLGDARIVVARASAPGTPIASVAVDLVVPTQVSSIAACTGVGNVMHLDGNDHIRNGMLTVTEATWLREDYPEPTPNEVWIQLTPHDGAQGNGWSLAFDTIQLGALTPGIYRDVERFHFASAGHAGMSISGNSSGCNTVSGDYQVHELTPSAVTISFEQHCEGNPASLLEGCVHVEM